MRPATFVPNRFVDELRMLGLTGRSAIAASAGAASNPCLLDARGLLGNRVYDADGNRLGKLEDIVIDTRNGCVRHVVLSVGGVLGFGRRRFAVPWSVLSPDLDYRRITADVTLMQLTAVPVLDDERASRRRGARAA